MKADFAIPEDKLVVILGKYGYEISVETLRSYGRGPVGRMFHWILKPYHSKWIVIIDQPLAIRNSFDSEKFDSELTKMTEEQPSSFHREDMNIFRTKDNPDGYIFSASNLWNMTIKDETGMEHFTRLIKSISTNKSSPLKFQTKIPRLPLKAGLGFFYVCKRKLSAAIKMILCYNKQI